jgi:HSP20 family molecular chaperone IbpA
MNENPYDNFKNLEDVLRHIMQMSEQGETRPIFIGMKIIIPGGGGFPGPDPQARGNSTEPDIEIHHVDDHVTLLTEFPGMAPEDIHVLFRDDRVFIWASDNDRQYRTSAVVPPAVEDSVKVHLRNGILEVSYLPFSRNTDEKAPEE